MDWCTSSCFRCCCFFFRSLNCDIIDTFYAQNVTLQGALITPLADLSTSELIYSSKNPFENESPTLYVELHPSSKRMRTFVTAVPWQVNLYLILVTLTDYSSMQDLVTGKKFMFAKCTRKLVIVIKAKLTQVNDARGILILLDLTRGRERI